MFRSPTIYVFAGFCVGEMDTIEGGYSTEDNDNVFIDDAIRVSYFLPAGRALLNVPRIAPTIAVPKTIVSATSSKGFYLRTETLTIPPSKKAQYPDIPSTTKGITPAPLKAPDGQGLHDYVKAMFTPKELVGVGKDRTSIVVFLHRPENLNRVRENNQLIIEQRNKS